MEEKMFFYQFYQNHHHIHIFKNYKNKILKVTILNLWLNMML